MSSFSTLQFPWIGKRQGGVEACLLDAQPSEVISIWTRISGGRRLRSLLENAYETGPFLQVSARFRSSSFKLDLGFRNVNRRSYSRQEFRNFGSPICLIPDRLLGGIFPSLHHRKEGWLRHQENFA